ncbi:Integrase core domain protein [compost metagenome]
MSHSLFRRGGILLIDDAYLKVTEIVGDKFQLRAAADGALSDYSRQDLLRLYETGRLRLTNLRNFPVDDTEQQPPGWVQRSIEDFPEPIRKNALCKWRYLTAICPNGVLGMSRRLVAELIKECAAAIGPDQTPPDVSTFYRWRKRWVMGNFDIRALIDKWELRGRAPKTDYPQEVLDLIVEGIEKVYLTEERETKKELRDWICASINKLNKSRPRCDALLYPSARLINRVLDQYDKYHVLKRRYGARIARQNLRIYGRASESLRPLQRVEVDHTPFDVLVVDEVLKMLLGRPWITVMIDHYSRMVVGLYVSFRKPSVDSVLRCLRHAILPKTYIKEKFPAIAGEWPCFGFIELLVCDNGLEFHASHLETACADIGTHIVYCEPRAPYLKGSIERFLKTLNYTFAHMLPGTTYSKYDKRLGYNSEARAVLTLGELNEALHRWVVDIYGSEFHRGIQAAPLQKWNEGVRMDPPTLVENPETLKVYLGRSEVRKLGRNGIQINSLFYASDELQHIRGNKRTVKVTVRFDPDDLGTIYVLDEERKQYIAVPCTDSAYASGLTLEQHNYLGKKRRQDYANLPYRDGLMAAKLELREFTEQLLKMRKVPKAGRNVAARAKEALQQHAETPPRPKQDKRDDSEQQIESISSVVEDWILSEEVKNYDAE